MKNTPNSESCNRAIIESFVASRVVRASRMLDVPEGVITDRLLISSTQLNDGGQERLAWRLGAPSGPTIRHEEFMNYVTANLAAIPNYADRQRHGEPIATGFRRVGCQPGCQQAAGQETADALDPDWRPSVAYDASEIRRVVERSTRVRHCGCGEAYFSMRSATAAG
jgi:hypothetical protein